MLVNFIFIGVAIAAGFIVDKAMGIVDSRIKTYEEFGEFIELLDKLLE